MPNSEGFDARIAVLEADHRASRDIAERMERRLVEMISDLKTALMDRIRSVEYALNGNGKPGLVGRMEGIERALSSRSGVEASNDRMWGRITPFIPWIGAALFGALMFYVGKKG